jgi:hypothetical protein
MVRTKRVSQEPTLLDLYAAMASIAVIQRVGIGETAEPAFIAHKSFEIAQEMVQRRKEIMGRIDE